ncbi:MAG: NAD(P)H-dependent glycerol-3-phosphate dehydrogenase [Acidimicrobiales bacterium]
MPGEHWGAGEHGGAGDGPRVCVLGAGSWGTTLASLAAAGHPTVVWARDPTLAAEIGKAHLNSRYLAGFTLPACLRATDSLAEALDGADVVVVGVPSEGFREVLELAAPHLSAPHPAEPVPVVSVSKGFEGGTLMRMTEVIAAVLPGHPAATLSGPNLAGEIMGGKAAASVVACSEPAVALALQELFGVGMFRVYTNHDVIGVEVGGALKNVIAIAAGIGEGLGAGDNSRAAVIARGLAEVTRLGTAMGGDPATFAGLAGLGDLLATCMSPLSRNRHVGLELGRGRALSEILAGMTEVAEGVHTAGVVMALARRHGVEMPICEQVAGVVTGITSVSEAYRNLLRVPPGHEREPY